jgi:hypothetical protein
MNLTSTFIKKKLATVALITASVAAFATLGDGGKKANTNSLFTYKCSKNFSLRSGYNYKSNNFLSAPESGNFIMLNTVVTYQKGNTTYIMPLKRKVILDKVTFSPSRLKF